MIFSTSIFFKEWLHTYTYILDYVVLFLTDSRINIFFLFTAFLTGQYADSWESPFATMAFFKFCGLSLAFIFHGLLCNVIKLYILGCFLIVAVISFAWLEIRLEHIRKIKNITRLWPRFNFWWSRGHFYIMTDAYQKPKVKKY